MLIVSAANKRFEHGIKYLRQRASDLGYGFEAYDLGELGFGRPMPVTDKSFIENGYYHTMVGEWKTRALHKPSVVADCLNRANKWVAYLDADTVLMDRLDDVPGDYDIGVTVRRPHENAEIIGKINAGVIFFAPTAAAREFAAEWSALTAEVGNDQRALNILHSTNTKYRFREFPTSVYNWYYFGEDHNGARIIHFKDNKSCLGEFIADDAKRRRV